VCIVEAFIGAAQKLMTGTNSQTGFLPGGMVLYVREARLTIQWVMEPPDPVPPASPVGRANNKRFMDAEAVEFSLGVPSRQRMHLANPDDFGLHAVARQDTNSGPITAARPLA
jgi:hypothetical protein